MSGRILPTRKQLHEQIHDLEDRLNQALNELDGLRSQVMAESASHGLSLCGVRWGAGRESGLVGSAGSGQPTTDVSPQSLASKAVANPGAGPCIHGTPPGAICFLCDPELDETRLP